MFKEKKTKYSSIAQLAERMTVNHDVAGSSPAGGANSLIDEPNGSSIKLLGEPEGL